MKAVRFAFSVVLLSLSTLVFAQSDAQKPVPQSGRAEVIQPSEDVCGNLAGARDHRPATTQNGEWATLRKSRCA